MRFGSALLSLVLPLAVIAHPHAHGEGHAARHHAVAKRAAGDVELHKRFSSARWSFYDVGLGACGEVDYEKDFIVALNSAQFDVGGGWPGPSCFKSITMSYNGKSTTAVIKDRCPGCPYGGLDLSRGLFRFFAAESVGIIYGEWHFNDGSEPAQPKPHTTTKKTPKPEPTTTKKTTTWKPEPTTTWKPEPTTTTHKETTSSKPKPSSSTRSSSSTVESTSSKTSSTLSESKTSNILVPTPVTQQPLGSNLQSVNQVFGALGGIVVAGAAA